MKLFLGIQRNLGLYRDDVGLYRNYVGLYRDDFWGIILGGRLG